MKLSVCIICKNEASTIARCLESVKWADEIILLDSGSTDNTLEIAKKYTDKIFIREDWQGFGEQRRRAEQLASNDWIFAIDCDEEVSETLKNEILNTLPRCSEENVLRINRLTYFCGQFIYHSGWHPDHIARIYNKKKTSYNKNLVHESVVIKDCELITLKENILHFQHQDIFTYLNKRNHYANIGAKQIIQKGKKNLIIKSYRLCHICFYSTLFFKARFFRWKSRFRYSCYPNPIQF